MNEDELRRAFEERKPPLGKLGEWVTRTILFELEKQLGSKMVADKFLQIPPKPRVKETDSFLEKALVRKRKENPLLEITDQVGVRFVVLLLEDIDRIGSIIKSGPWTWQKDRDHEQERLEKPDYFAYQSDHYVVRVKAPLDIDGVNVSSNTPCEIQVRTILQHAYAEMAHFSDYKPSIRLPEEEQRQVKRSLAKGSALIETTDDVFKEIKRHLSEYDKSVRALLVHSSEIYRAITGESSSPETSLGLTISDTYRELLKEITPEILPRLEYLWVICSVLTLNLAFIKCRLKKTVELSAGGIKGVLFLLSNLRPDEWPSLFFKKIEGHILDRFTTKRRLIIEATYHFATKHPHMIAMSA